MEEEKLVVAHCSLYGVFDAVLIVLDSVMDEKQAKRSECERKTVDFERQHVINKSPGIYRHIRGGGEGGGISKVTSPVGFGGK